MGLCAGSSLAGESRRTGDGGFAHPALGGRDGNDFLHVGDAAFLGEVALHARREIGRRALGLGETLGWGHDVSLGEFAGLGGLRVGRTSGLSWLRRCRAVDRTRLFISLSFVNVLSLKDVKGAARNERT